MTSDSTPPVVTTVTAPDGPMIHLMAREPGAPSPTTPPMTLCRQPVDGRVRARAYHRLGCVACAAEALSRGVTAVPDLNHAILNLPRFLAARRSLPLAVPDQRVRRE